MNYNVQKDIYHTGGCRILTENEYNIQNNILEAFATPCIFQ